MKAIEALLIATKDSEKSSRTNLEVIYDQIKVRAKDHGTDLYTYMNLTDSEIAQLKSDGYVVKYFDAHCIIIDWSKAKFENSKGF